MFGLVGYTPSLGRKVGIPRGILPHIQGAVRARLKPLFQADGVGSELFHTEPGIMGDRTASSILTPPA